MQEIELRRRPRAVAAPDQSVCEAVFKLISEFAEDNFYTPGMAVPIRSLIIPGKRHDRFASGDLLPELIARIQRELGVAPDETRDVLADLEANDRIVISRDLDVPWAMGWNAAMNEAESEIVAVNPFYVGTNDAARWEKGLQDGRHEIEHNPEP